MIAASRLASVLDLHFDPRGGAPYWLERARSLSFDPRRDVRTLEDLRRFGPMPLEELARRPVEDFIPRSRIGRIAECISSETGGTTGAPKRTAYFPEEFHAGFVAPFLDAARLVGFPREMHWLFVGPSGPHIIGKAARACAAAMGSIDPFAVDFDPRWARALPVGSMARRRYLEHVVAQAEAVIATQHVGVLFATPPVVEVLADRLTEAQRERIVGIHLGGMRADPAFRARLLDGGFPNAVVLAGYGNSLAGMCPQLEDRPGAPPAYFPHGDRLHLEVDAPPGGSRGPVVFHRLDESAFLPFVVERDEAEVARRPDAAADTPFHPLGIADPRPRETAEVDVQGLY